MQRVGLGWGDIACDFNANMKNIQCNELKLNFSEFEFKLKFKVNFTKII